MDTEKQEGIQADGYGDETLNTSSAADQQASNASSDKDHRKGGIHNNALFAASMGRPATAQVDPHSNRGLANTGTNISYEGPTAAGAGGSAGTGYTSGQSGAASSISTDSDYDQAAIGKRFGKTEEGDRATDVQADEAEDEINEQR
jgi:hypothetical protein